MWFIITSRSAYHKRSKIKIGQSSSYCKWVHSSKEWIWYCNIFTSITFRYPHHHFYQNYLLTIFGLAFKMIKVRNIILNSYFSQNVNSLIFLDEELKKCLLITPIIYTINVCNSTSPQKVLKRHFTWLDITVDTSTRSTGDTRDHGLTKQ